MGADVKGDAYEGLLKVNAQGVEVLSQALTNLRQAYGLDLPGLLDADRDGFVDR